MKVLVFTDLHHEGPARRVDQCVRTMEWVAQLAVTHAVDAILNGGDLTNRAILSTPEEVAGFNNTHRLLSNLNKHGWGSEPIQVHHNLGNHDKVSTSRLMATTGILDIHPSVAVHDQTTTVEIDGVPVDFIPYGCELPAVPTGARIAITHMDLVGVQYNYAGWTGKHGHDPAELARYDLVINGHIHRPGQTGNILCLGSALPQRMDYVDIAEFDACAPRVMLLEMERQTPYRMTFFVNPHATRYVVIPVDGLALLPGKLDYLKAKLAEVDSIHARLVCLTPGLTKDALAMIQPYKGERLTFQVLDKADDRATKTVVESTAQKLRSMDDQIVLDRIAAHVHTTQPGLKAAFERVLAEVGMIPTTPEALTATVSALLEGV